MEIRVRKWRQVEERARTEGIVGRDLNMWRSSSVARSVRSMSLLCCSSKLGRVFSFSFLI